MKRLDTLMSDRERHIPNDDSSSSFVVAQQNLAVVAAMILCVFGSYCVTRATSELLVAAIEPVTRRALVAGAGTSLSCLHFATTSLLPK